MPPSAIRVDLGIGSPVGELGLVYSRPVARRLALEGGVGIGVSGVQVSAMAKLRLGRARLHFVPGIGVSAGLPVGGSGFTDGHPGDAPELRGDPVTMLWLDADLAGVEYRRGRIVVAASGGVTMALTEGHWDAIDLGGDVDPGSISPQVRVGVGWAL